KPDGAIDDQACGLKKLRQSHLLPICSFEGRIGKAQSLALVARIRMNILPFPLSQRAFVVLAALRQIFQADLVPIQNRLKVSVRRQRLVTGPGFGRCSAPGSVNQTDRYFQTLIKLASEEVP